MANTIKVKQSSVQGKTPTTAQLELGELAINTYDGKLFLKKNVAGTESIIDVTAASSGTVTSVAATVPTGFTVSGSPVTTSGTLSIAFDTGYALPTSAKQTNWDTAYGWGNHASAGYLTSAVTSVGATAPVASSGGNTPTISLADGYGDTKNPFASKTQKYVLAAPNNADGVPSFRALVASDIPTLNQNTTGSAASLSVSGQTGLLTVTGLASTNRVKTVRDAADTVLELGGSYTPSGTWNWTSATVTWPTFNQDTTGSAVYWKTAGTGKAGISGPAVGATRTYTFPDADATVLYSGGALGTPSSGTLTNCTFPTLNQNTTGSAASLSISGQTGLLTFTGLAANSRAKTVRDAADTVLELGGSYTPTGTWVWTSATVTWPTFNQDTTGSAVYWKTAGTGKAALSGPAVGATRTYTFPDADTTVLTTNAAVTVAQGGTGVATLTGIVKASGTSAFSAATAGTDYAKPDTASSWSGTQTFNNSAIRQLGSSTGYTTLTSSNAGASNYTYYLPASNTYAWISSYHHTLSGPTAAHTYTFPDANATVLTTNAAVTVSQGGTGATTLTGILVGNGTSAFSAAVSGTDIKTVNGSSLLGSGDVAISASQLIFTGFDGGTASTSTFDMTLDLGGA